MKKITTTVTVNKDMYISTDGKQFDTELQCREYEKSKLNEARTKLLSLNLIDISTIDLGIPNASELETGYAVYIDSAETINIINNYVEAVNPTYYEKMELRDYFGSTALIVIGYDEDYIDFYNTTTLLLSLQREITNVQISAQNKYIDSKVSRNK